MKAFVTMIYSTVDRPAYVKCMGVFYHLDDAKRALFEMREELQKPHELVEHNTGNTLFRINRGNRYIDLWIDMADVYE